jgi:hypothetical protein
VLPHSAAHRHALGVPDDFSRRIARNVQIILAEESHLDKVIDPAGGSFTIEAQTHDLAQAASQIFRKIEQQGGMEKALCSGMIAQLLDESWSALAEKPWLAKPGETGGGFRRAMMRQGLILYPSALWRRIMNICAPEPMQKLMPKLLPKPLIVAGGHEYIWRLWGRWPIMGPGSTGCAMLLQPAALPPSPVRAGWSPRPSPKLLPDRMPQRR